MLQAQHGVGPDFPRGAEVGLAPEAAAAKRCILSFDEWLRRVPSDLTAMSSAFMSAVSVAVCTVFCHFAGSIFMPFSKGVPSTAENFAASPGFSSSALARPSCARSSLGSVMDS